MARLRDRMPLSALGIWKRQEELGWPLWAGASSLEDLGSLVVRWLEGHDRVIPWHIGPPDPETREISAVLKRLNSAGYLTTNSQPAVPLTVGGLRQRAWVSLIAEPSRAQELIGLAERRGFAAVHLHNPLPVPITSHFGFTVSRAHAEPVDLFLPGRAATLIGRGVRFDLVDLQWGRKHALWNFLDGVLLSKKKLIED